MCEILAPAGGQEQLLAAVRCGADAVYLGAGGFNARQNAENFGGGRLRDAVGYCRARDVKVHVTVNTLVTDRELPALEETVEEIAMSGADAVIIQDLAVLSRFRERCPEIARHASTQMTIHDLDGAKMAADLGFSRVVLARELTLGEIEHIAAHCGIETEVFIHGALCMSMSGACYLSAMLGGRSGNRGWCAQPCRLNFKNSEREYALSLKDMSHISHIRELRDAGVASFKIEGRMKRPEYVAAAVTACRAALRGEEYDEETLRAVFSRSGFTDGYLTGRRGTDMFGVRGREDVAASSKVLGDLASLYRAERRSVPVNMEFTMTEGGSRLAVECEGERVEVEGAPPQPAVNRPLDDNAARRSLEKTGGTPYFPTDITLSLASGMTLPASALNAMRREALEKLTLLRSRPRPHELRDAPEPPLTPHRAGGRELRGRFEHVSQMAGTESLAKIILPLEELERAPELIGELGERLICELPALNFDGDGTRLEARLEALRGRGLAAVMCENLYAVMLGRRLGLRLHGGAGLNISNSIALNEYRLLGLCDATVSFELTMSKIGDLRGEISRGIVAYGYLPLMRFRACPVRGKKGCGDCRGCGTLSDRRGVEFTVLCHFRQFGTLLNSLPLDISGRPAADVDFLTLSFTTESAPEVNTVVQRFLSGGECAGERTGGLYYRGVK